MTTSQSVFISETHLDPITSQSVGLCSNVNTFCCRNLSYASVVAARYRLPYLPRSASLNEAGSSAYASKPTTTRRYGWAGSVSTHPSVSGVYYMPLALMQQPLLGHDSSVGERSKPEDPAVLAFSLAVLLLSSLRQVVSTVVRSFEESDFARGSHPSKHRPTEP